MTDHISILKSKNFRITQARSSIISVFNNSDYPLTAANIYKLLRRIGLKVNLTTIYREIEFLLSNKVIEKIPLLDTELHYAILTSEHRHYILCESCGEITALQIKSEKNMLEEVHKISTYNIKRHTLVFFGICPNCK